MENKLIFEATTHRGLISIQRTIDVKGTDEVHQITMTPAEASKASYIVGFVLKMRNFKTVPDHITNTPFVIRFFNDAIYALERTDKHTTKSDSLPFRFHEIDDLLKTIDIGVGICVNEQTLGKALPASSQPLPGLVDDES